MAFELKTVVPWGRSLHEYTRMFNLTNKDFEKRIVSFGDGPSSFNVEMTTLKKHVVSLDPIYQYSKAELNQRIVETKATVIEQIKANKENFIWDEIKNIDELEQIRMQAMNQFIDDFENGKRQERYVFHALPNRTEYDDFTFDLGLSSHFLILYSQLGFEFHINAMNEMLRICKEIRIFPLVNLDAIKSELLEGIIKYYNPNFAVEKIRVNYEFQKNGNEMLVIKR